MQPHRDAGVPYDIPHDHQVAWIFVGKQSIMTIHHTITRWRGSSLRCRRSWRSTTWSKVAWIFMETQTSLTILHTIISKNSRFPLARINQAWYLKITNVKPSDRGFYMCQLNSDPMMTQKGIFEVKSGSCLQVSTYLFLAIAQDITFNCFLTFSPA